MVGYCLLATMRTKPHHIQTIEFYLRYTYMCSKNFAVALVAHGEQEQWFWEMKLKLKLGGPGV
jgi:hypothetical protein